ncbi:MAG: ABC transporter permease, partial [Nanoarchaeota archaeon]|nr:ABC transporter permease [Nanoarchaeota archaeon]
MRAEYFTLAFRNLKKRGIRSWLTMLGIFIGIAAVVSLISLGNALQTAITGQFSSLSPDLLLVTGAEVGFGPPGSTAVKKLIDHDLNIIEAVSNVDTAIPRLIRVVKVEFNKASNFYYIASIPSEQEQITEIYSLFSMKILEGRLLTSTDRGKVVLGNDFISNNEFGKKIRVGTILKIQGKNFEVIGILKKASSFQINSAILMPEDNLKEILNIGDEIDAIAVKVNDEKNVESVAEEIKHKLRKDRNEKEGEEDFQVQTPVQALQTVNTILSVIKIVITGIAAISLLIGGIGIANTMFTSVLERTKEIGVMKAIGAKNSDILYIFLIESGLLGLVG